MLSLLIRHFTISIQLTALELGICVVTIHVHLETVLRKQMVYKWKLICERANVPTIKRGKRINLVEFTNQYEHLDSIDVASPKTN